MHRWRKGQPGWNCDDAIVLTENSGAVIEMASTNPLSAAKVISQAGAGTPIMATPVWIDPCGELSFVFLLIPWCTCFQEFQTGAGSGIQFAPGLTLANYIEFFTARRITLPMRFYMISFLVVPVCQRDRLRGGLYDRFYYSKALPAMTLLLIIAPF